MKKKLAFVLALAMILAMFAGCGGKNANDTANKGNDTATTEKTEDKKEETKTEDKKEEAAPSRDTVKSTRCEPRMYIIPPSNCESHSL